MRNSFYCLCDPLLNIVPPPPPPRLSSFIRPLSCNFAARRHRIHEGLSVGANVCYEGKGRFEGCEFWGNAGGTSRVSRPVYPVTATPLSSAAPSATTRSGGKIPAAAAASSSTRTRSAWPRWRQTASLHATPWVTLWGRLGKLARGFRSRCARPLPFDVSNVRSIVVYSGGLMHACGMRVPPVIKKRRTDLPQGSFHKRS